MDCLCGKESEFPKSRRFWKLIIQFDEYLGGPWVNPVLGACTIMGSKTVVILASQSSPGEADLPQIISHFSTVKHYAGVGGGYGAVKAKGSHVDKGWGCPGRLLGRGNV